MGPDPELLLVKKGKTRRRLGVLLVACRATNVVDRRFFSHSFGRWRGGGGSVHTR